MKVFFKRIQKVLFGELCVLKGNVHTRCPTVISFLRVRSVERTQRRVARSLERAGHTKVEVDGDLILSRDLRGRPRRFRIEGIPRFSSNFFEKRERDRGIRRSPPKLAEE